MKGSTDKKSNSARRFYFFERCSGGIFNLKFDSKILESFYVECSFPRACGRFRFGSAFVLTASTVWLLYTIIAQLPYSRACTYGLLSGAIISAIALILTFVTRIFKKHYVALSATYAAVCCLLTFLTFVPDQPALSFIVVSGISTHLVILFYTMIPLRLWQLFLICAPLSVIHIILSSSRYGFIGGSNVLIQIIAHFFAHSIGIILHLMSQVWRRSTFLRMGYSALMDKELRKEKEIRDDMIRSLMPNEVAQEVMKEVGGDTGKDEDDGAWGSAQKLSSEKKKSKKGKKKKESKGQNLDALAADVLGFSDEFDDEDKDMEKGNTKKVSMVSYSDTDGKDVDQVDADLGSHRLSLSPKAMVPSQAVSFRKFHVNQLENVSVLFADIVGFTKMSSNKTASRLVYLLNDLFGRFDQLCELTGCEKIATLGDCYYCVAGCPNPVADHAERTVEMGRSMCVAIQQFDEDHNEEVNMRVGVHTGNVICGLVGTRRFKFDVWSNDVTLANEMESTGQPGKVHISETTLGFVKDIYEVSEGEPVPDIRKYKVLIEFFNKEKQCFAIKHTQDEAMIKTYFIEKRLDGKPICYADRHQQTSSGSAPEPSNAANAPLLESHNATAGLNGDQHIPSTLSTAIEQHPVPADKIEPVTSISTPSRRSDAEMLEALQGVAKVEDVFSFPPISRFTLNFRAPFVEAGYRRLGLGRPKAQAVKTISWSTPRVAPLIYATLEFCLFLLVLIACIIVFPDSRAAASSPAFYIVAAIALLVNIFFMTLIFSDFSVWCLQRRCAILHRDWRRCVHRAYMVFFRWPIRNIIGAFLLIFPSAVILSNYTGSFFAGQGSYPRQFVAHYRSVISSLFSFMLLNFTLFISFSFWTKSLTACVSCAIGIILIMLPGTQYPALPDVFQNTWNSSYYDWTRNEPLAWIDPILRPTFTWEVGLILLSTLALVVALNRELDISFRLSFYRDFEALQAKQAIAQQKVQADWLLENIIPYYIMDDLRQTHKYSQHIADAAVVFATISNFSEFYDEQYQGGQEMLRVLNEIFADFEHMLASPRYKDVEKIKTIGACFMAASGLNMIERARNKREDAHLWALMDFALDLIKTLDDFNRQMFNFQFELKVGYNIGEVTAGVIGTTKLLYDIWGDTVNVASRMYSTGQKGRIQVTEAVAKRLESRYSFEYRGDVFVKGKGDMKTYLLVDRSSGAPEGAAN